METARRIILLNMESIFNSITFVTGRVGLTLIFALAMLIFLLMSVIYMYHWREYSMDVALTKKVQKIYFGISGIFVLGALIFLFAAS